MVGVGDRLVDANTLLHNIEDTAKYIGLHMYKLRKDGINHKSRKPDNHE